MEDNNSPNSPTKKMTLQEEIEYWQKQGYKPGEMKAQAERNLMMR